MSNAYFDPQEPGAEPEDYIKDLQAKLAAAEEKLGTAERLCTFWRKGQAVYGERADALAALVRDIYDERSVNIPFGWHARAKELLEPQAGEPPFLVCPAHGVPGCYTCHENSKA